MWVDKHLFVGVVLAHASISAASPAHPAVTAPVTFRVTVPANTPPDDPVFIAGDFQGWNPGLAGYELADLGSRVYEITLDLTVGTSIQFKFTRGDWGKVEKGPSGEELANRSHPVTGAATLELTVANWADLPANSTVTGNVTTHNVPGFLNGRRVWVYLPPDYDTDTERRYPVLYMLDGQNVFDAATSFAGEWEVDESCEALIAAQSMAPVIVVAVENGGASRIHEYTPWYDAGFQAGGGGEAHLQAFIDVLMPWVDAAYRTKTGPRNTGLAGSSLGGLMALYAAYAHPEVFGLIGALSPAIWWSDQELLDYAGGEPKPPATVYVDMGTQEYSGDVNQNGINDGIDDLRAMRDVMVGQGFVLGTDLMVVEDEGGLHNEAFWADRFPVTLQFLFPPAPPTPVLLSGFTAVLLDDAVEIRWSAGHIPAGSVFRLESRRNERTYEVAIRPDGRGGFRALDEGFRSGETGAVAYSLYLCAAGGSCELLAERRVPGNGTPGMLSVRPNPFRASTEIRLDLPAARRARVTVHDLQGRIVAVLLDGSAPAGPVALRWSGLDPRGLPVPAGEYFMTLETDGARETRKLTLVP